MAFVGLLQLCDMHCKNANAASIMDCKWAGELENEWTVLHESLGPTNYWQCQLLHYDINGDAEEHVVGMPNNNFVILFKLITFNAQYKNEYIKKYIE